MKQLTVISGKGGTGKTTLTAAIATLSRSHVLADCDVDAADLHLILEPTVETCEDFQGGKTALIDADACVRCDECVKRCRFDAIHDYTVNTISCEGCGVCAQVCPQGAVSMQQHVSGQWFVSRTRAGYMVHARLGIAEENSGKLVTLIRQEGRKLAESRGLKLLLTDGPPGIGCPVIASLGGATAVLIVTEPTVAGRHDMERVAELAAVFRIPAMVCTNKFDLNLRQTEAIEGWAQERRLTVLGRIPFDPVFTAAMVQGRTVIEYDAASAGAGGADQAVQQAVPERAGGQLHRDRRLRGERPGRAEDPHARR